MRVLHVVADGDPGWAATAALAIIDAIPVARGVRHTLVTETGSPLASQARARGIPTATRAFSARRRFGALRPRLVETVWEMAPDVVHAHGIQAGYAVLPAVRWLGLPLALSMPAVDPPRANPLARLLRWYEREAALRGAQALLFGTEAELAAARTRGLPGMARAMVATLPLDLEALPARRADAQHPLLLLQGRIHADFACGRVVAALAGAPQGARLLVLGDGPGLPRLAHALEAAGLAGRVEWPGPLPRHEALARLATASLVVDPRSGGGVPIGLIEAAAIGVPVLTPARPALAEALGIEGLDPAASDSAWGEAAAAACAGQAVPPRGRVRDWIAAARGGGQYLRAWEAASHSSQAQLADLRPRPISGAADRTA